MLAGVSALVLLGTVASAGADELSEKAVKSFMEYAWSLTPQQFSKPDGSVIVIDKTKKSEVLVPIDVARDVIMAGRLSAHAQICDLLDDQISNHRALMRREEVQHKWTPQQMVYISQLHLTTVMLLTGRIKLVEKQGDKEVVVDESKEPGANVHRGAAQEGQGVDHGLRGGEPATAQRRGGTSQRLPPRLLRPARAPRLRPDRRLGHRNRRQTRRNSGLMAVDGTAQPRYHPIRAGLRARV